jgi:hypothetical protein
MPPNLYFVEGKNDGRKPDNNSSLRRLEIMPAQKPEIRNE